MQKDKYITLKKASEMLGVTSQTLRNWDNSGKIKTMRTLGGHRRIPMEELDKVLGVVRKEKDV